MLLLWNFTQLCLKTLFSDKFIFSVNFKLRCVKLKKHYDFYLVLIAFTQTAYCNDLSSVVV